MNLGSDAYPPEPDRTGYRGGDALSFPSDDLFHPSTSNPAAEDIAFTPLGPQENPFDLEADLLIQRFREQQEPPAPANAMPVDMTKALELAMKYSREFKSAEEDYILAALRLLIERHLWGPRFFDDVSATVSGVAEDNAYNSAIRVVNELGVTQRLPYGGEVSARLLARATEDLRERVQGENVQSADLIVEASVPLLRGAGLAARSSRIQAERDLVYAARDFESFRRDFLVDVARDFLSLVVQLKSIDNSERQLVRLVDSLDREQALVRAGRQPAFEAALSAQDVLFAQDRLRSQRESYRLAIDRFIVRLGLPIDQDIVIVPSTLGLPTPSPDIDTAVRLALAHRLDLQNRRDGLADTARDVDIARNDLLPDLNISGSVTVPTEEEKARSGLQFDSERNELAASVTFGLPLDREIERVRLRQAQISAERSLRDYDEFRDNLVVQVRDSVREIERARYSLQLQEKNIEIAQRRQESIDVAPDRATARDRSDAAEGLTEAENQRDEAARDLQVAILEYLLNTGTLRVNPDGTIRPLAGMSVTRGEGGETGPDGANNDQNAVVDGG